MGEATAKTKKDTEEQLFWRTRRERGRRRVTMNTGYLITQNLGDRQTDKHWDNRYTGPPET